MRKISELGTDECCEVLCMIARPVQNIVDDKKLMSAIGTAAGKDAKSGLTAVGMVMAASSRIVSALPVLLRDHREDVYAILSAVGGVSADEVKGQNIITTMQEVKEILQDKELLNFFRPSKHMETTVS